MGEGGGGRPDSVSHTSRIRDSWVLSPGSGLLVWGSAEAGARCTKHGLRVRSLSNSKTFEHDANFLSLYIVCIIYIIQFRFVFVLSQCVQAGFHHRTLRSGK